MEGACVSAYWLTPTTDGFMIPQACADKNGEFKLTDLLAGNYRLEVGRGTITSSNPFEKFYYSNATKKEDAQVIAVGPGVQVRDLVIRVEKTIPLIKVSGRLTFQDGRGFPEEPVRFEQSDVFRHERVETETDKDGNFSVTLPEGWTGHISAETNIYDIRFEKCEAVKKLRNNRRGAASKVPSNTITINGEKSLDWLRLTFPLPYCPPYD